MTKQILRAIYKFGAVAGYVVMADAASAALWPIDKVLAVACGVVLAIHAGYIAFEEISRLLELGNGEMPGAGCFTGKVCDGNQRSGFFDIAVPDEDAEKIRTVQDVIDYLGKRTAKTDQA